jgi:hypothetical protein
MKLRTTYVFAAAAVLASQSLALTIALGHDAINNYAWISGSQPCPGTTISPTTSSYCGHTFTLGSSKYRLSKCGATDFQLQEEGGDDGWVFNSYCYPPDSGDLSIKCGGGTEQWVVVEQFKCGVRPRP